MAAPNFANQTFDESEEEDDDFNPQPVGASDDEIEDVENSNEVPPKPSRPNSAPRARSNNESDDEAQVNGRDVLEERRNGRAKDGEDVDEEIDRDNGEDDEGEGEDLNGGLDDDDEDEEDDDEDEEAVSVGHHSLRRRPSLANLFPGSATQTKKERRDEPILRGGG
jgi:transcription elongation factor SPT5